MTTQPTEIVLSRAELIYALNHIKARYLAGMELKESALPEQEFSSLLKEGEKRLAENSLLVSDSKTSKKKIIPGLANMVKTVGCRDMAFILVRGLRGYGQQLFVFNLYKDWIVEHTLPEEGKHRLMSIASTEELLNRFGQFIPLRPVIQEGRPQFRILQTDFDTALKEIRTGNKKKAISIFNNAGLSQDLIKPFIQTLEHPEFTLSLACLRIENDEALDASSTSIFADQQSAWGIWPDNMEADPPILLIFPSGITDIYNAVTDWLEARNQGR